MQPKTKNNQIILLGQSYTDAQIKKRIDDWSLENMTAEWLLCELHNLVDKLYRM